MAVGRLEELVEVLVDWLEQLEVQVEVQLVDLLAVERPERQTVVRAEEEGRELQGRLLLHVVACPPDRIRYPRCHCP